MKFFRWFFKLIAPKPVFWSAKSEDSLEKYWASLLYGDDDAGQR